MSHILRTTVLLIAAGPWFLFYLPSLQFSRNCMFPGNANLLIGVLPRANQEIGVPRLTQSNSRQLRFEI